MPYGFTVSVSSMLLLVEPLVPVRVIAYEPAPTNGVGVGDGGGGGVGVGKGVGVGGGGGCAPLPPQAPMDAIRQTSARKTTMLPALDLRLNRNNTSPKAMPTPKSHFFVCAVAGAMGVTVTTTLTVVTVFVSFACCGLAEQVIFAGAPPQLRETVPTNPLPFTETLNLPV